MGEFLVYKINMSQSESSTKDSTTKDGDKEAAAALTREKKRCKVLK